MFTTNPISIFLPLEWICLALTDEARQCAQNENEHRHRGAHWRQFTNLELANEQLGWQDGWLA